MFAYCNNNPVMNVDHLGMWTIAFGRGANANFGLGGSISDQLVIDSRGNISYQKSYAIPGVNNTFSIGAIDASGGVFVQCTGADSYQSLEGHGTAVGFSSSTALSWGVDFIELAPFEEVRQPRKEGETNYPDGFQASIGMGIGLDVHIVDSYTETQWSFNIFEELANIWNFVSGVFC